MSPVRMACRFLPLVALIAGPARAQDAPKPIELPARPAVQPPPTMTPPPDEAPAAEAVVEDAAPPSGLIVRIGVAGITLPEASDGTFSAQPEVRLGWFSGADLALQAEASVRVWPLGPVAARSYGVGGNLLWFPPPLQGGADLYLLGGGGGYYTDPAVGDASFDPVVRGGVGMMVPLKGMSGVLAGMRFAFEYRGEMLLADETDFVSGVSMGISREL